MLNCSCSIRTFQLVETDDTKFCNLLAHLLCSWDVTATSVSKAYSRWIGTFTMVLYMHSVKALTVKKREFLAILQKLHYATLKLKQSLAPFYRWTVAKTEATFFDLDLWFSIVFPMSRIFQNESNLNTNTKKLRPRRPILILKICIRIMIAVP